MNFKRPLIIILSILAVLSINATGGEFSIHSGHTKQHAENPSAIQPRLYSSVQFLPTGRKRDMAFMPGQRHRIHAFRTGL